MNKIIGFAGKARSGKDVLALILSERCEKPRVTNFVHALYLEVQMAFLVESALLRSSDTKDNPQAALALRHCSNPEFVEKALEVLGGNRDTPRTPREILQTWGTDYRRAQDVDYWVKRMRETIETSDVDITWLITGVRFENERRMIASLGGAMVHVERPAKVEIRDHETENPLPKLPGELEISNGGTLHELMFKAGQLFSGIEARFNEQSKKMGPRP